MKLTVIALGTLSERAFAEAFDEYKKRLSAAGTFTLVELKESKLPKEPSAAQIAAGLKTEAEAILSHIPARAYVVAMAIEGKLLSSEELAAMLDKRMSAGAGEFVFVVGSSYGLDPSVKARADMLLSMSPMTFPHQLARVMLAEQLYRCTQILAGGKYHK